MGQGFYLYVDDVLYEISKQGGKLPYKEIRSAIYSRRELLDTVKTPVLVNFDMWAGNVFLSQKRTSSISAIIDFERSFLVIHWLLLYLLCLYTMMWKKRRIL